MEENIKSGKCDINLIQKSSGATLLILAAGAGQEDVVKLLIANKCNLDLVDSNKRSAFIEACSHGYAEIAISLIEAGCDYSLRDKESHFVLWGTSGMDYLWCKYRVEAVKVNAVLQARIQKEKEIALHKKKLEDEVIFRRKEAEIKEKGLAAAKISFFDAAGDGEEKRVKDYLDNNHCLFIDTQCENTGDTALIRAAANGRLNVVELLIAHGCDMYVENTNGEDAFNRACVYGRIPIIDVLIKYHCELWKYDDLYDEDGTKLIDDFTTAMDGLIAPEDKNGKSGMDYLKEIHPDKVEEVQVLLDKATVLFKQEADKRRQEEREKEERRIREEKEKEERRVREEEYERYKSERGGYNYYKHCQGRYCGGSDECHCCND